MKVDTNILLLTPQELRVLIVAVDAGLRSGEMLRLLSGPEDDGALIEAIVKLRRAAGLGVL